MKIYLKFSSTEISIARPDGFEADGPLLFSPHSPTPPPYLKGSKQIKVSVLTVLNIFHSDP